MQIAQGQLRHLTWAAGPIRLKCPAGFVPSPLERLWALALAGPAAPLVSARCLRHARRFHRA
jgi:hypothetical protein